MPSQKISLLLSRANLQQTFASYETFLQICDRLSQEEIEKMKREAEANAEADKKAKEKADKINEADSMIFQTEKQIKEFGDKLPSDKKASVESALDELKKAHQSQDVAQIQPALDRINQAWKQASEDIYKAQQAQGEPQPNTGSQQQQNDDNVQDADFEEVK